MNTIIIIAIVLLVVCGLLWLFSNKTAIAAVPGVSSATTAVPGIPVRPQTSPSCLYEAEVETEAITGRRFRRLTMQRSVPRFTYLKGRLTGKFWAERETTIGADDLYVTRYQFQIYEVTFVVNKEEGISRGIPFPFEPDTHFPMNKLPATIPCQLIIEGGTRHFGVVLHEPQFSGVYFPNKLQQEDGDELFGTIETLATGYILDDIKEIYEVLEYLPEPTPVKVMVEEEEEEVTEVQKWKEKETYRYDGKQYQSVHFYTGKRRVSYNSYYSSLATGISWLVFALCIVVLLPRLLFLLPLIVLAVLFRFIPALFWEWLVKLAFAVLLLLGLGLLLFPAASRHRAADTPHFTAYDSVVTVPQSVAVADRDATPAPVADTVIRHYRKWYDYAGKLYEGSYYVKTSDYQSAHQFKNNIAVTGALESSYDYMLYLLKEHDQHKLPGLYQLFDSLQLANKLDSLQFANMVVSFVQQIPYCLVLDKECSPALYADAFIRNYLQSDSARCDSNERFGINTPVEFVATSKGDCDTRTLLLYAIFRHYQYQVAVLSSEYYNHSLLGIHLPLDGQAIYYNNTPYYCWETTAAGMPAGVLAKEVANLQYWRISLTSQ